MPNVQLSPSGPVFSNALASVAIDHGSIGTKAVLEAAGAFAGLVQTNGLLFSPKTQYNDVGLFFSHARFSAAGVVAVGVANMTGLGVDPNSVNYAGNRYFRSARYSPSGLISGFCRGVTVNVGAIPSLQTLVVDTGIGSVGGLGVVVSPRLALPAGIALSHGYTSGFTVKAVLANLTGGPITPGDITLDVASHYGASTVRSAPSGLHFERTFNGVAIDHGSVGAAAVLEATATVEGVRPGDIVNAAPRAAFTAGIALSHARVTAPDTVAVGLANLTGGGIDPAAVTYDITVFGNNV